MSKLQFSPIDQAFLLGSDQIKDTQKEIENLKKIVLQANVKANKQIEPKEDPNLSLNKEVVNTYQRIGPPDKVTATFNAPPSPSSTDIDYNMFKLMQHPKFDEIVQNYILMYKPGWLLSQTNYTGTAGTAGTTGTTKEGFGMAYSSTAVSEIQKYVLFFVVSVCIFLILSVVLKES